MQPTTTVNLVDGVRLVVPNSLHLITPYVLLEQQDWFEDEIKFLRRLLKPAENVIDIGANYGTYTLSMAKTVRPTGRVWAFEPASQTAELLNQSIAVNDCSHIVLDRRALSATAGTAQLSINANSELNALVRDQFSAASASETVPVTTLDACLDSYGWQDIAFVKIDAEGEEANILQGGKRFFAVQSPLVQYEIKVGAEYNMKLIEQFDALGYASYRLVPGLDLLVPFDGTSAPDGYLLNLFCCKRGRAEQLAVAGYLLDADWRAPTQGTRRAARFLDGPGHEPGNWRNNLAKLPYGKLLRGNWEQTMTSGRGNTEVERGLSLYSRSRDSKLQPGERYNALKTALGIFSNLCKSPSPFLRLASLARIARDFGARSIAVHSLEQLSKMLFEHKPVDLGEPFLVPADRFDLIPPGNALGNWVFAAALEELERLAAFSSFYTGLSAKPRLAIIQQLGFGSAEMQRRSQLLERRFGPDAG